ncbi:MAG: DUF4190 domain-containing protein, partial [Propionibacteriales bacterium]|nr:DUF4190 domain-containing protein [Propionibacteriales bacterium]
MTHTPVQHVPNPVYVRPPSNGVSTASLVLGIIGALIAFIPVLGLFGAFLGVVAIGLAIAGLVLAGKRGAGKGKSIAGLVLGIAA